MLYNVSKKIRSEADSLFFLYLQKSVHFLVLHQATKIPYVYKQVEN